ncbi:MAG: PIN domain-containing protein [Thermodesulfovibrionales bacterium]|nr:PIN domain-containing protein [Thermodesulfovibrionales bacterium]
MKLFIDTGAFIALTDMSDENHQAANNFYMKAKEKGIKLVTTNFVVCETMNYLRAKVSHDIAVAFREGFKKSSLFEIIEITPLLDEAAFRIFKQYADKDFSFTDCTSFAAMHFLKLRKAFAFDKHFEQYDTLERLP